MVEFCLTVHNKRTYLLLEIDTSFDGVLSGIKIRDNMSYNLKFLLSNADTRFYKDETFQLRKGKNWIRTSTGYLNWTTRDHIQLNYKTSETIYSTPLLKCPLPRNSLNWTTMPELPDSEVYLFIDFINMINSVKGVSIAT